MELYLESKDDLLFTRSWCLELRRSFNSNLLSCSRVLERSLCCFPMSFFVDILNQTLGKTVLVLKLGFRDPKRRKFL